MKAIVIPSGLANAWRILWWARLVMRQLVQTECIADLSFAPALWPSFYWGVEEALRSCRESPWELALLRWRLEYEEQLEYEEDYDDDF